MNYDFFAALEDKKQVLNFVFNDLHLKVYDVYSALGQELNEYKNTDEIINSFRIETEAHLEILLHLWSPDFGGGVESEKITLDPRSCKGHTFRFSSEGWGLIQLYLGGVTSGFLKPCHLGHNSQKRALAWENTIKRTSRVDDWNWKNIEQISRKLKYHIHNRLALRKEQAYGILPGADSLERSGIQLAGLQKFNPEV